jgi:hypothetical protein
VRPDTTSSAGIFLATHFSGLVHRKYIESSPGVHQFSVLRDYLYAICREDIYTGDMREECRIRNAGYKIQD